MQAEHVATPNVKPKSIQAEAMKLLIAHAEGYSFYQHLNNRCSAIGVDNVVLSRSDVTNALETLKSLPTSISILWLETIRMQCEPLLACTKMSYYLAFLVALVKKTGSVTTCIA